MTNVTTWEFDLSIEEDFKELFGCLTNLVSTDSAELKVSEMQAAADLFAESSPRLAWQRDADKCRREDLAKQRGQLILNPAMPDAALSEGCITERDGKEYRIILCEWLRGAKDKKGNDVVGYWLEPAPSNFDSLVPSFRLPDVQITSDFYTHYKSTFFTPRIPLQNIPIQSVVSDFEMDVSPVDAMAVELPKASLVQQTKLLKQLWRSCPGPRMSLRAYARQCKWGRAWLDRKKRR